MFYFNVGPDADVRAFFLLYILNINSLHITKRAYAVYYLIGKSGKQVIVFSRDENREGATLRGEEIINHFKGRGVEVSDIESVSILPYNVITWACYDLNLTMKELINIVGGIQRVL